MQKQPSNTAASVNPHHFSTSYLLLLSACLFVRLYICSPPVPAVSPLIVPRRSGTVAGRPVSPPLLSHPPPSQYMDLQPQLTSEWQSASGVVTRCQCKYCLKWCRSDWNMSWLPRVGYCIVRVCNLRGEGDSPLECRLSATGVQASLSEVLLPTTTNTTPARIVVNVST